MKILSIVLIGLGIVLNLTPYIFYGFGDENTAILLGFFVGYAGFPMLIAGILLKVFVVDKKRDEDS